MVSDDELLLHRCCRLAANGLAKKYTHPLIAWVLTDQKKTVLAEACHQKGSILSILSGPSKIPGRGNTLYINHLPHLTKEDKAQLAAAHIRKIIAATSAHSGSLPGGITLTTSVLEDQERFLNRRYYTFRQEQRPYVILKWAQTADGFVARDNYDSKWISGRLSRKLVHKWRSEEAAIMVATRTARYDNPRLNVRDWSGHDPLRVVVDRHLRLDKNLHLFDRSQPTICYNLAKEGREEQLEWVKLGARENPAFINALLHDLFRRNIVSLIVEGGAQLLASFVALGLWDEARVFTSPETFGSGIAAPHLPKALADETHQLEQDELRIYRPVRN